MSVTRRLVVGLALMSACFAVAPLAAAQAWPTKQPIRFLIPYPPGGASDVTARLLAVRLTESLGQSVIVENRPGANGIVALDAVAKAAPDGYTLLMGNLGPNAINPGVYEKLPYDPIKDFTPITLTSIVPLIVMVNPSLPIKSVPDLIAYAKANPGKLTYASAGNGSANHLAGEMLKTAAGIDMVHVPYKGDAPGIQDVIAGNVNVVMPTLIGGIAYAKQGSLRAIATTGGKRSPAIDSLPTVNETLKGFEAVSWGGVMGPGHLPPEIVARLNTEVNKILKQPDVAEKLASMGAEVVGSTPEQFATYLRAEVDKWGKVAHDNHIRLD